MRGPHPGHASPEPTAPTTDTSGRTGINTLANLLRILHDGEVKPVLRVEQSGPATPAQTPPPAARPCCPLTVCGVRWRELTKT